MANNPKDQPGRVKPNETENQPGYQPEKETQRRGFDEQRKDEVSSPPPGGIDPNRAESGEEQGERKDAGNRDDDKPWPRKA